MAKIWSIDRIENGFAVLYDENENRLLIEAEKIGGEVREGVLVKEGGGGEFFVDEEESRRRKEKILSLKNRLKRGGKNHGE